MFGSRSRRLNMPTGIGAIAFLIVAVLLAVVLSRVIGVLFHLIGYVVAFGVAVLLLSWLWGRFTRGRSRSVQRWEDPHSRDEYGRRRY